VRDVRGDTGFAVSENAIIQKAIIQKAIIPYDLGGSWCEECGRPKSLRLFPGSLTGCATCDEVVTRHRCTRRPDLESLALGESWECPECDTLWTAAEKEDWCSECGRSGMTKGWDVIPGDRIDTTPRRKPQTFTPFRSPDRQRRR
jgi:hypothetical protein